MAGLSWWMLIAGLLCLLPLLSYVELILTSVMSIGFVVGIEVFIVVLIYKWLKKE